MYKTILTYLASPQMADHLSEFSAFLADTHRAHLIGAHNEDLSAAAP